MKIFWITLTWIVLTIPLMAHHDPPSISISYFGETITHPGFKLGLAFPVKSWTKAGKEIDKAIYFGASTGMFYHRRYQTGLFASPELSLKRKNVKGNTFATGVGLGYLRTFIPNTYEINVNGDVQKTIAGHDYLLSSIFVSFGKSIKSHRGRSLEYFVKPQFLYATPNFPNGVGYFALEIGINI